MIKLLATWSVLFVSAQSIAYGGSLIPDNESFVDQIGGSNTAIVGQVGGGNSQTTLQGRPSAPSFNNIASTSQSVTQGGGSNRSTTIQLGAGSNISDIMQMTTTGAQNNALTIQNGFANVAHTTEIASGELNNKSIIMQTGVRNTATVTQK
jgi:hypothetical protein